MILPILLSLVFIILAIIHINWVFGGQFGFDASLPTNEAGKRVLNPKKVDSAIVGVGLLAFAYYYLCMSGILDYALSQQLRRYAGWVIPSIFILRAIGDFKYIGFFKHIKQTTFGKLDSKFFSPLCLLIGITGYIVQLLQ